MTGQIRIMAIGIAMLAAFLSICAMSHATADVPAQVPKELQDDVNKALAKLEKESPEDTEFLERLKEAGASYLPELTVPAARLDTYTAPEKQAMMVGVYTFDLCYAVVFSKYSDCLNYADAINKLLSNLGYNGPKIVRSYKKAVQDFSSPEPRKSFEDLRKAINQTLPDIIDKPTGLEVAVEITYGGLIEAIYVTSQIVAQKDYSQQFLDLLSEQKNAVRVLTEVFEAFGKNPVLAEIIKRNERLLVLRNLFERMEGPQPINKADVEAIRSIVSKVRADIIK